MMTYKIREDKVGDIEYSCDECRKSFQDKDIIYELDMYDDYHRFCSMECITRWFEPDIEQKQIEVYPMTKEQKTHKEVWDIIKAMQPNTKVSITDNLHVDYYELEGMKRHYLVYGNSGIVHTFTCQSYTVDDIIERLK